MISRQMLTAARLTTKAAEVWLEPLTAAADEFEINTPERVIPWLANLSHESAGFTKMTEDLHYSEGRLLALWPCTPKRMWGFTYDEAKAYANRPEDIANRVYANRFGNGPSSSGDGWTFRGRGPIQLTFRANYAGFGQVLGVDLEGDPDLAADPTIGSRIAGRYWLARRCNELADAGDFDGIRKAINGGLNGIEDVRELAHRIGEAA